MANRTSKLLENQTESIEESSPFAYCAGTRETVDRHRYRPLLVIHSKSKGLKRKGKVSEQKKSVESFSSGCRCWVVSGIERKLMSWQTWETQLLLSRKVAVRSKEAHF